MSNVKITLWRCLTVCQRRTPCWWTRWRHWSCSRSSICMRCGLKMVTRHRWQSCLGVRRVLHRNCTLNIICTVLDWIRYGGVILTRGGKAHSDWLSKWVYRAQINSELVGIGASNFDWWNTGEGVRVKFWLVCRWVCAKHEYDSD